MDRAREQRLWLLAGASLLIHAMALSLTPLWPEAERPAPPPVVPVDLVEPHSKPQAPPARESEAPQPVTETAPQETPQYEAAAETAPPRPARDEEEEEEEETAGEAAKAGPGASASEASAVRPDDGGVGYPVPLRPPRRAFGSLDTLSRVQRSFDCFEADPEDPETYRLCGGVKPLDLVPEELRDLDFEDPAAFVAAMEARKAKMRGKATPMGSTGGGHGCMTDIHTAGC